MSRKGFALLEVLVIIVIIATIAGGGFYFKYAQDQETILQPGVTAEQRARVVARDAASATIIQQDVLDQLIGSGQPTTPTSSAPLH